MTADDPRPPDEIRKRIVAAWLSDFPDVMGDYEDSDFVDPDKLADWIVKVLR